MYFQIENTPEHVRRARRIVKSPKESPKEECPCLILAPFTKPPQVVFDNVFIGSSSERDLELFNPSKQTQQIKLGKALPPGLVIQLPGEWIELEPETCYCVTLQWTPMQPTAMRETIRFTNENRGRYDVIVVLKSTMNMKGKNQPKGFKTSPGKMKKKIVSKKSPGSIYKKKSEFIYNTTTKIKKTVNVVHSTQHKVYQTNKENPFENFSNTYTEKCPFDSSSIIDLNFDTSGVFSKQCRDLQDTYDKSYNPNILDVPHNVLKPSNKVNTSASDIFDNLTFTPMKSIPKKADKLDKGPKIIMSVDSDGFDDSLDANSANKENQTHSIMSITTSQPANNWLTVNHQTNVNTLLETPTLPTKKHPNTSSPKEFNSPNFSINTDFSRISDLSFFPQRFSTERKFFPIINETQEMREAIRSDTYTKSPVTPLEQNAYALERPPHFFMRHQPKMCRQTLFREYQMQQQMANDKQYLGPYDHNVWHSDPKEGRSSPGRSITPPLQSIPEESAQSSKTQILDKTDQMNTFTINRTFDKTTTTTAPQTWAKKAVGCEPDLWKLPISMAKKAIKSKTKPKESLSSKINTTFESNRTYSQNLTINQIGNVYSQSFTVDPFLSSTYFYEEESVEKFENEFKRWLNCILTPPAELDSNVEQKIDVGKAWIENRNKDVPLAPTKEQVCNMYHNSHRLASLRKSARDLFLSPEIAQVFLKLNAQIEKKLIAIRTDRNLHLDVGLQKIIMELILSYNPLWLRIGLEAIYGIVLPLKSNNDIEGLTTFIIQRMFKNPFLKNKHSKSSAPNMLLPAYMEAIKKFTLKKFFMLVFFLDQAKQRKLIQHDPCLFCRNAICKESREIVIRFTRELIAGIGDITRHLRPLGYVVCHKQSYLDEYKYAVHNLALDIKDGVRLTKVMEIIMMKNGLLNQLRTPAISRLQKIHNVQVAMNALKEANFVIVGEITAADIADGHREKTLSLLWQLIHVFRAPLFEKAANVIQVWWRKKFEVILAKRKEEEKSRMRLTNAASTIQSWWRRIQYNQQVEWQMQRVTAATVVVQKYCRMWLQRTRLQTMKTSVLKIETWYRSIKLMREARTTFLKLYSERVELRRKSAVIIQSCIRRWLCVKQYRVTVQKIVHLQTAIRRYLGRTNFLRLKKSTICIQRRYRAKLLMRREMQRLAEKKHSAVLIQSYFRMIKQRRCFLAVKKSAIALENRYIALIRMREERDYYIKLKTAAVKIQRWYKNHTKGKVVQQEFQQTKQACVTIQSYYKAYIIGKKTRQEFVRVKTATITIQKFFRSYIETRTIRRRFFQIKTSTVTIQRYYRSCLEMHKQRQAFLQMKSAVSCIETCYQRYKKYQLARNQYLALRKTTIFVQRWYRSLLAMKLQRSVYIQIKQSALIIQHRYRALLAMRTQRTQYENLRQAAIIFQTRFRAQTLMKQERTLYIKTLNSTICIQRYYRAFKLGLKQRRRYLEIKQATINLQRRYRALLAMRKEQNYYYSVRKAAICIQRRFRAQKCMQKTKNDFVKIQHACRVIQCRYRARVSGKRQREDYLRLKAATTLIQNRYRILMETRKTRHQYLVIRSVVIMIQRRYRANMLARSIKQQKAATKIQTWYKTVQKRNICRREYLHIRKSVITIQSVIRMFIYSSRFLELKSATLTIQRYYRSYKLSQSQQHIYIQTRRSIISLQSHVRSYIQRKRYLNLRSAVLTVQAMYRLKRYRALLREQREISAVCLQKHIRRYLAQSKYRKYLEKVVFIQRIWREKLITRLIHCEYLQHRRLIIRIQSVVRGYLVRKRLREQKLDWAASKIQALFRGHRARVVVANDSRVALLRRRWREGALRSTQQSLRDRNDEALDALNNMTGIEMVINSFRSLELLTEVFPMMYNDNAGRVVRRVFVYMSVVNRSISSIDVLKSAAAILVNLARYRTTGPKIYDRESNEQVLRYMLRYSNTEQLLFSKLTTYLWLFSKYDNIKKDLTEFFHLTENHKILLTIRNNVVRAKRMATNTRNKYSTPQLSKLRPRTRSSMNMSVCCSSSLNTSILLPAVEPDYGIIREDKPRYFEDAHQAINCLFNTYNL